MKLELLTYEGGGPKLSIRYVIIISAFSDPVSSVQDSPVQVNSTKKL